MKKKILSFICIFFIFLCIGCSFRKNEEYTMNLYYMDTYIYVKFYCDNNCSKVKEEIDNIYKSYHQLSDRYLHYEGVFNVYDIYYNEDASKIITLDSKLYELLEYAKEFETKNNLFSIEIGSVIDVWKKYRELGYGLPTNKELLTASKNVKELILLGDNKIKNNHPNLDLGAISKGYATKKVGEYLENQGISDYLINAGGNVLVGENQEKDNYSIGIQGPNKDGSLVTIVKGNNISVVTSGSYERYYTYEGKNYSHIIDPNTFYPADKMKSVTVITKDSALGDLLSTTLFLMDIEDGLEFIKEYDAEAIWVTNNDELIRSEGFANYE